MGKGWKTYIWLVEQVPVLLGVSTALLWTEFSTKGKIGLVLLGLSIMLYAHRESLKRIEDK